MTFKRVRVWPRKHIVNALSAASFATIAACGSADAPEPGDATTKPDTVDGNDALTLPAVWATTPLRGVPVAAAYSGGGAPLLAIAYEGGGLEMFNLDADLISDAADDSIVALADGQAVVIDGVALSLFPAITEDGRINAFAFGGGLDAPQSLDLPIDVEPPVAGVCAGAGAPIDGQIFALAYWTEADPRTLVRGNVVLDSGDLAWRGAGEVSYDAALVDCEITPNGPIGVRTSKLDWPNGDGAQTAAAIVETALLDAPGARIVIAKSEDGGLWAIHPDQDISALAIRDGITVRAPRRPLAMAALGQARFGGYPGGVLALAGETAPGEHQAVFIDTLALTRPDG